eukprot:SAG22_NODE_1264_length_4966_cov_1.918430_1_plen_73_part_10
MVALHATETAVALDFNGDGLADVFLGAGGGSDNTVLFGAGELAFGGKPALTLPADEPGRIAIGATTADFNADG